MGWKNGPHESLGLLSFVREDLRQASRAVNAKRINVRRNRRVLCRFIKRDAAFVVDAAIGVKEKGLDAGGNRGGVEKRTPNSFNLYAIIHFFGGYDFLVPGHDDRRESRIADLVNPILMVVEVEGDLKIAVAGDGEGAGRRKGVVQFAGRAFQRHFLVEHAEAGEAQDRNDHADHDGQDELHHGECARSFPAEDKSHADSEEI